MILTTSALSRVALNLPLGLDGKPIPYPPDSVVYAGVWGLLAKLNQYILFSLPPGPPLIAARHVVNLHKILMLPVFLGIMAYTDIYDCEPYWQLAYMHGFYGIAWVIKDFAYGDRCWLEKCTVLSAVGGVSFLMINHGAASVHAYRLKFKKEVTVLDEAGNNADDADDDVMMMLMMM